MGIILSEEQIAFYKENGYLANLPPIFNKDEVKKLNAGLDQLSLLLKPNEKHFHINGWHKSSAWLYQICTHPKILDYVEDLLGPNFFVWGSHFFSKAPGSTDTVAWHQDAPYWPLKPHNSVTVWLAFTDVGLDNGAMKVIPGTHRAGLMTHKPNAGDSTNVLRFELERGSFKEEDAVSLLLEAGSISIHDDALIHGSPANRSDRWRVGLTIRYSGTDVKCDRSVWKTFEAFMARGVDDFRHNPHGKAPEAQFARPEKVEKEK
jgi:non-heme Fe2+,alpha-ketoglutarate-dependent halogenase